MLHDPDKFSVYHGVTLGDGVICGAVPRIGWLSHDGEGLAPDPVCPRSDRAAGPDQLEEVS